MGSLEDLIRWHIRLRPDFETADAYKMLYQSVFGIEHILHDKERRYLEEELSRLEISRFLDEPLIESISTDNSMVRVNLRPFKTRGLSPDDLFAAMIASAKETRGTQRAFLKLWNEFKSLVEAGKLNFDKSALEDFDEKMRKENYPPCHHSERYKRSRRPAYRVLKRAVFKRIFTSTKQGKKMGKEVYLA